MIPARLPDGRLCRLENFDCYRNVEIDVINASQVVRQITIPNAFVIGYKEDFTDDTGTGVFTLLLEAEEGTRWQI